MVEAVRAALSVWTRGRNKHEASDLLQRLGSLAEARVAFTAAAALATNTRERALLQRRAAACVP